MSSIFLFLQNVYENVHVLPMKSNYSEPKIFTGGVDVNLWSKLTNMEKRLALNKDWDIYYSFRNPNTGKLIRQTNIKAGVNRYKDKRTRLHILKVLQQSLEIVLREGFNPYKDNTTLADYLQSKLNGENDNRNKQDSPKEPKVESVSNSVSNVILSINDGFIIALELKKRVMSDGSFVRYKSHITMFEKWLLKNGFTKTNDISSITKKNVIQYLNTVLLNSSTRNRNNARSSIASFYQVLEDNK